MARLDYFLIWDHGIRHRYEILSIIRAAFEILAIHRRSVGDISDFVRRLYACDTVPYRHLIIKTRYLLKLKPNIIFVLVKNHTPDEQMVGAGAFRHIQCTKVNRVKKKIREFNPAPEHHVVHASDYESQVRHTMKLLGIKRCAGGKPGKLKTVRLNKLRAKIIGVGLVDIGKTPHYLFVSGDRKPYEKYYDKHMGIRLTDDHTPQAFDSLINSFNYKKPIRVCGDRITDGVHRAAILKYDGVDEIEVEDTGI